MSMIPQQVSYQSCDTTTGLTHNAVVPDQSAQAVVQQIWDILNDPNSAVYTSSASSVSKAQNVAASSQNQG